MGHVNERYDHHTAAPHDPPVGHVALNVLNNTHVHMSIVIKIKKKMLSKTWKNILTNTRWN